MAAELRIILLAVCVPLLAGIWWWSARRAGHGAGNALLRESAPKPADAAAVSATAERGSDEPIEAPDSAQSVTSQADTALDAEAAAPRPEGEGSRGLRIAPLEPLEVREEEYQSMRTDFGNVPVLDAPMMVDPQPPAAEPEAMPRAASSAAEAAAVLDSQGEPGVPTVMPAPAQAPKEAVAERQKIVTLRVCAPGEARFAGAHLQGALDNLGLLHGKYGIFHRRLAAGQSVYCVASLVEPGTFDPATMAVEEFRGVTFFAVLPGPLAAIETLDDLLATACALAEELGGVVQDARGVTLTPQRAVALREDVAKFQASLGGA